LRTLSEVYYDSLLILLAIKVGSMLVSASASM